MYPAADGRRTPRFRTGQWLMIGCNSATSLSNVLCPSHHSSAKTGDRCGKNEVEDRQKKLFRGQAICFCSRHENAITYPPTLLDSADCNS